EPRLAFEAQPELPAHDLVAQRLAAIAVLREERVAEDDVRFLVAIAERLELVGDVRGRSAAVGCQHPVRAVGAELRTTTAGAQRETAAERPPREGNRHRARRSRGKQIP